MRLESIYAVLFHAVYSPTHFGLAEPVREKQIRGRNMHGNTNTYPQQ